MYLLMYLACTSKQRTWKKCDKTMKSTLFIRACASDCTTQRYKLLKPYLSSQLEFLTRLFLNQLSAKSSPY